MDTVTEIISAIFNVATMSTSGVILRLALLLLGGVAAFFISRWIKKKLAEAAHKKTEERRDNEQGALEPENRELGDNAKGNEDEIEKIINDREGKKE